MITNFEAVNRCMYIRTTRWIVRFSLQYILIGMVCLGCMGSDEIIVQWTTSNNDSAQLRMVSRVHGFGRDRRLDY